MKLRSCFAAVAVSAGCLLTTGARADTMATVSGEVFLRAGPAPTYPAILPMPVGAQLTTHGCIAGYTWCDVSWGSHRGWVSSPYIRFDVHGQSVAVTAQYAAEYDVAVVSFGWGYWQTYYVGMPWFGLWNTYYLAAPPPGGPHGGPHGGSGPGHPGGAPHGGSAPMGPGPGGAPAMHGAAMHMGGGFGGFHGGMHFHH